MSLLTLERSSPSPQESENEDLLSTSSYEGFVARKHYAMCLSPRPITSLGPGKHGEQLHIYSHLKKLVKLIRPEDMLRLAVELENSMPRKVTKYLVIITTTGNQDTEEVIALGTEQEGSIIRLCLVLPLWRDTEIKLDGDGGFIIHTTDRHHIFKPTSVQSMWTALQTLYKATENARAHNHYVGGLSHTWMSYYQARLTGDGSIINEWSIMEDVISFRPDSPIYNGNNDNCNEERAQLKSLLVRKLRKIMLEMDLEEATSRMLRTRLEKEVAMNLSEYKEFLDVQMLRIFGQMERPSQIHEYLYLGSEWNASNLDELKELGVKYILNISREIDNFYPEEFKYLNIRLYDVPSSELMRHWDKTYQFIKEAKENGKKVLVHCKMGISRSAATVIAYTMKEYDMPLKGAIEFVKGKRSVINPNDGFMNQLKAYEGILKARHNELWGKKAPSRLRPLFYQMRSVSEPNLQESLHREGVLEEPELSFLDEEGMLESSPTSPKHTGLPGDTSLGHWSKSALVTSSMSHLPPDHSSPVDKEENIRNFLNSLPPLPTGEDDQGIGCDNVYTCTSESGSGYSSPILTPTDDEHFHMQCSSDHAARHSKESKSRSHMHALSGAKVSHPGSQGLMGGGSPEEGHSHVQTDTSIQTQTSQALVSGIPPKPAPPPDPRTIKSKGSPPPLNTTQLTAEHRQPVALVNQLPFTHVPSKALRSASLPKKLVNPYNTLLLSSTQNEAGVLNSNKSSPIPVLQEELEAERDHPSRSHTHIEESIARRGSADDILASRSEDNLLLLERQHRRVKSGSDDTSGPVKDPQIQSVPERIKQIERMNTDVTTDGSVKSGQQVTHGSSNPVEFFIAGDGHAANDKSQLTGLLSRSSSEHSLGSASSSSSGSEDNPELEQIAQSSLQPSSPPLLTTRHTSLSPKPSVQMKLVTEHVRHSSLSIIPTNVLTNTDTPPNSSDNQILSDDNIASSLMGAVKARILDIEERNKSSERKSSASSCERNEELSLKSFPSQATGEITSQASSSMDFTDGPFSDQQQQQPQILSETESQEVIKRRSNYSPLLGRPSSEIINNEDSQKFHLRMERRDSTPPELFSAWSRWISAENIPTKPVVDLKRKFEDSDSVSTSSGASIPCKAALNKSGSNLRRSQSLRNVESPSKKKFQKPKPLKFLKTRPDVIPDVSTPTNEK